MKYAKFATVRLAGYTVSSTLEAVAIGLAGLPWQDAVRALPSSKAVKERQKHKCEAKSMRRDFVSLLFVPRASPVRVHC